MATQLGSGFDLKSQQPLDSRAQMPTMEIMVNYPINELYEGIITFCVESGKTYQWKSTNDIDPITGQWRILNSGGGGSGGGTSDYTELDNKPKIITDVIPQGETDPTKITIEGQKTYEQYGLYSRNQADAKFMEKLTIDSTPTLLSENLVSSGGVEAALSKRYTKTEIDNFLSDKVSTTDLEDGYYDKTQIDAALAAKADKTQLNDYLSVESAENDYVSKTGLNTELNSYYNKTMTDNLLANKANSSDLDNYYNQSQVDSKLAEKVNTTDLTNEYYTKTQSNTLLADKVDKADLANDYYTKTQVDTALSDKLDASEMSNYYTSTQVDAKLDDKVNTSTLEASYYTKTEVNDVLEDKADKATLLDNYYTKTNIDDKLLVKLGEDNLSAGSNIQITKTTDGTGKTVLSVSANIIDDSVTPETTGSSTTKTWSVFKIDAYIATRLANMNTLKTRVVNALPTDTNLISETTMYLLLNANNTYDIWMYLENEGGGKYWSKVGDTAIDLSNYYTKAEIAALLQNFVSSADFTAALAEYVKSEDLATVATSGSYNDLVDKPIIDTTLDTTSTNLVQNKVVAIEMAKKANDSDLANVAKTGAYSDLSGKPVVDTELSISSANAVSNSAVTTELNKKVNSSSLADVALSNDYRDLDNKPTIDTELDEDSGKAIANATVAIELKKKANKSELHAVATSGDFNDLLNKPTGISVDSHLDKDSPNAVSNEAATKGINGAAHSLNINYDQETYILSFLLLDKNANTLSSKIIDLPIEQLVVDGSYDNDTKKISLSLKNGNKVEVPIGSLINGLVPTTREIAGIDLSADIEAEALATALDMPTAETVQIDFDTEWDI